MTAHQTNDERIDDIAVPLSLSGELLFMSIDRYKVPSFKSLALISSGKQDHSEHKVY